MDDGWDYGSVDDQNSNEEGRGETDDSEEVLVGVGLGKLTRRVGQRRRHQLDNYLRSIKHDAQFVLRVAAVCEEKGWGLWPNLRNGLWYVDPSHGTGTCYFKSTDGHSGKWDFSASRLNLHLASHAARAGGAVLVDSTRRGKAYPDALTYTVPIWCAVINAYLTGASPIAASPPSPPLPPPPISAPGSSTPLRTATSDPPPPRASPAPGARNKGGGVCVKGGARSGGDMRANGVLTGGDVCGFGVMNGGDVCVGGVMGDAACEEDAPSVLFLPPWVPPSEADRICQLLPSWIPRLHTALDGTDTLTELQHVVRMPKDTESAPAIGTSSRAVRYQRFRPLWVKHGDDLDCLWEDTALQVTAYYQSTPDIHSHLCESKEFVWIVCVSASRHRSAEEHREHHSWHYIQGASDDAENWARPHGITPQTFWAHIAHHLQDTDDVESMVRSIGTDAPNSDPRTAATTARAASTHTHARTLMCTARAIAIGDTGIYVGTHECAVAPDIRMAGAWGGVLRIVDTTKTRRAAWSPLDPNGGGSRAAMVVAAGNCVGAGGGCGGAGGCSGCGGLGGGSGSRGADEGSHVCCSSGNGGGGGDVEDSLIRPAVEDGHGAATATQANHVSCSNGSSSSSSSRDSTLNTPVTIELSGARREWAYRVIPQALHAYHMYATAHATPCERPPFLITCDTGTDASVAVAVALLLAYFDADLRPLLLHTSPSSVVTPPRPVHDKGSVRRCVMSVQRYHGTAHPRREWMKEVRVYFSSRPRPATATAKDAMEDVDA